MNIYMIDTTFWISFLSEKKIIIRLENPFVSFHL